jgi:glutathione synthase/RimK-type ligase-like ATP-grasp enzyme
VISAIIANSLDLATDYIVWSLRSRNAPYFRVDLDLLANDEVVLDPILARLTITSEGITHTFSNSDVCAIFYRAPAFLRESSASRYAPQEQLKRHQWAAFARSLTVFDGAKWINHPGATYLAEIKPYQLRVARRIGLDLPDSLIANFAPKEFSTSHGRIALKALDSFLVRIGEQDSFFYTLGIEETELSRCALSEMPVMLQQFLEQKVDYRVTVVGDRCFSVSITTNGRGIDGDWRLEKNAAVFSEAALPKIVTEKCLALVRELGLVFGAIDLACVGGRFYFLEINPTGEWAWLVDLAKLPIDMAITDALLG